MQRAKRSLVFWVGFPWLLPKDQEKEDQGWGLGRDKQSLCFFGCFSLPSLSFVKEGGYALLIDGSSACD